MRKKTVLLLAALAAVLGVRWLVRAAVAAEIREEQQHAPSSLFASMDRRRDG